MTSPTTLSQPSVEAARNGGATTGLGKLWCALIAAASVIATSTAGRIVSAPGVEGWYKTKAAGLLLAPYAAWVAFATVLNVSIVQLNVG